MAKTLQEMRNMLGHAFEQVMAQGALNMKEDHWGRPIDSTRAAEMFRTGAQLAEVIVEIERFDSDSRQSLKPIGIKKS